MPTQFKPNFINAAKASILALSVSCGAAHAASIIIPDSALNSSPGVYTPGGYYTTDLGPNIVTTGGGNGANVGQANGRNDDGYMALNLGFDFMFFGTTYDSLFINNNGNVSFGAGISAFVPTGPTGANAPLISPFFGDVDTRNSNSGVVHYNLSSNQLIVTWDNVGYYNTVAPPTNSFQLVLRSADYALPFGEGAIGFFYQTMGWDRTATSTVGATGFGDGAGNSVELASSLEPGLDTILQNQYLWFNANLEVVPPPGGDVPAPATIALLGLGLASLGWSRRKKV